MAMSSGSTIRTDIEPGRRPWTAIRLFCNDSRSSVPRRLASTAVVDDWGRREPVLASDPASHRLERVRWVRVEADLRRGGERMDEVDHSFEQQKLLGRQPQAGPDDHTIELLGLQRPGNHPLRRLAALDETGLDNISRLRDLLNLRVDITPDEPWREPRERRQVGEVWIQADGKYGCLHV